MTIAWGWKTFFTVAKIGGGLLTKLGSLAPESSAEPKVTSSLGKLDVEYYKDTGKTIIRNKTENLINFYISQRSGQDSKFENISLSVDKKGFFDATDFFQDYSEGEITISPCDDIPPEVYGNEKLYSISMSIDTWKEQKLPINTKISLVSVKNGFLLESRERIHSASISLTDSKKGRIVGDFGGRFKYYDGIDPSTQPTEDYGEWIDDYWYLWMPQNETLEKQVPYYSVIVDVHVPMKTYLEMMNGGCYDERGNDVKGEMLQVLETLLLNNIQDEKPKTIWSDEKASDIVKDLYDGKTGLLIQIEKKRDEKLYNKLYEILFENKLSSGESPNAIVTITTLGAIILGGALVTGIGGLIAFAIHRNYEVQVNANVPHILELEMHLLPPQPQQRQSFA